MLFLVFDFEYFQFRRRLKRRNGRQKVAAGVVEVPRKRRTSRLLRGPPSRTDLPRSKNGAMPAATNTRGRKENRMSVATSAKFVKFAKRPAAMNVTGVTIATGVTTAAMTAIGEVTIAI